MEKVNCKWEKEQKEKTAKKATQEENKIIAVKVTKPAAKERESNINFTVGAITMINYEVYLKCNNCIRLRRI